MISITNSEELTIAAHFFTSGIWMYCQGISASSQFLTRNLWWLMSLLGLLICDIQSAWATCGDYLHEQNSFHGHRLQSHPFGLGPMKSAPGPRCHGRRCQREDRTPATPSQVIEIPVSGDGILTVNCSLMHPNSTGSLRLVQADAVTGPANRIFRPPRAV